MEKDNNGITGGIGIIGNNTTCSNSITTAGTNNTILPPKVWKSILYYKNYIQSHNVGEPKYFQRSIQFSKILKSIDFFKGSDNTQISNKYALVLKSISDTLYI